MNMISDRSKILYLIIFIVFLGAFGAFWLDHIGLFDLSGFFNRFRPEPQSVVNASDDEPSLVEKEEFEKEKQKLQERIEELDKREALVGEREKSLDSEKEKIDEMKKGIELQNKKFDQDKKKYSGYKKNVQVLAQKIYSMPPEEAVKILVNWEDPLIIDVLRQLDADASSQGKQSITPYLLQLIPDKEKASHIMYLMTQL